MSTGHHIQIEKGIGPEEREALFLVSQNDLDASTCLDYEAHHHSRRCHSTAVHIAKLQILERRDPSRCTLPRRHIA